MAIFGLAPSSSCFRYGYPALVGKIKEVARAHGFSGEFLAAEMLWRTPLNAGAGQPWVYTEL